MSLITSRQQLTTLCERAYQTWPDVRAILLFGSQAKGTAHPDSDWDIAVIVEDPTIDHVIHYKREKSPSPFDGYDNLDVLTLTPAIIAQDRHAFGRIAQQIDQDGTPVIGDWIMTPNDPTAPTIMDPNEWGLGITTSLNHMTFALNNIDEYKQRDRYDNVEAYCRSFVESSQMAAEHLVKTMLKRRKVPPVRTHDMERLAAQMRDQRPDNVTERDWTALTARIESLNEDSHRDHQAGYGDYQLTAKDITRAAARLSETFRLLVDEVESALHPKAVQSTMGLSNDCLGDDSHQELSRANGQDVLVNCHRMMEKGDTVWNRTNASKTTRTTPSEPVRSFLALIHPLEDMISPPITERIAALASTADHDVRNPFEVDISTTTTPSAFDTEV
ncbi:MAG: nucleotidyltransferase domain-containing protein [Aestuariivita sp.]|nr:nucleotidyltransferase domain-containing protein [Aestuariivita sp.]MCY4345622.1 nucleotidyltransferase domain-containing protein [Aestuariivita sp.]